MAALRFRIRSLLVLVVLAALTLGVGVSSVQNARLRRKLAETQATLDQAQAFTRLAPIGFAASPYALTVVINENLVVKSESSPVAMPAGPDAFAGQGQESARHE